MKITYIHHSSFLVECSEASLLFDYVEGRLPELNPEKPLIVFASHAHGDHFSPLIFTLRDKVKDVRFVLSSDIPRRRVPGELAGQTLFIKPHEQITLPLSQEQAKSQAQPANQPQSENQPQAGNQTQAGNRALPTCLEVQTFDSTDQGVAFLLRVGEVLLYHAGDLNNWVWDGEPEADNEAMSARYHRELQRIAEAVQVTGLGQIHTAFVPLDPRQERDFSLGMDDFMRMVGAKHVFPMHFWGDFEVTERFLALPCTKDYRDCIIPIHRDEEVFELEER